MTSAAKARKKAKIDQHLRSGHPLSTEALAHHLGVDRGKFAEIAKKRRLERDGSTYPWHRIWRAIYGIEGFDLANHLAELQARHPASIALAEIEDLEAALREPLINFAEMALRRHMKPNTLSRRLKEGHETLPFPMIHLGGRLRHFRPLEVDLWIREEIRLDLPEPPVWVSDEANADATDEAAASKNESDVRTLGETDKAPLTSNDTPSDAAIKAAFGAFAPDKRTSAG